MGLLDDAIRQHLELKRQHGAEEEEVRRQEQEALGPPRRGEVPQPLSPPDDSVPVKEAASADPAAAGEEVEDPTSVQPAADLEPPATAEQEVWLEEPEAPAPAAYAAPPPEDSDTEQAVPGTDDVLEETPEFLQETPEHDRLWFEQKPPKDFDFDK